MERYEDIAKMKQKLINKVLQNKEIDEALALEIIKDIIAGNLCENNTIALGKGITCRITGENNYSVDNGPLHYQLIYTNIDESGTKDHAYPTTTDEQLITLLIQKHQSKKEENKMINQVQKVNKTNSIIATLEKGSFLERRLARKIKNHENTNTFGIKEFKRLEEIKKSLYKIFLKSLSKEQAAYLIDIDNKLNKIINQFEQETGWIVTREYIEKTDNYINEQDPEFATHDTYRINRNENGIYLSEEGAFNSYFESIHQTEAFFYASHKKTLELIHELFSIKEYIMGGNFEVKDERVDREYLNSIARYLGYKSLEETKKLTK